MLAQMADIFAKSMWIWIFLVGYSLPGFACFGKLGSMHQTLPDARPYLLGLYYLAAALAFLLSYNNPLDTAVALLMYFTLLAGRAWLS